MHGQMKQVRRSEHDIIGSTHARAEEEQVLRDKLRMPPSMARSISAFIRQYAEVTGPSLPAPWPNKDSDDQWIVAAATEGNTDMLVSRDQDLLEITDKIQIPVIFPAAFGNRCTDTPGCYYRIIEP